MTNQSKSNSLPYYKVVTYLSAEAQEYLAQTTDGTSHYAILNQLMKDTAVVPTTTTKRGNVIKLHIGQVECSIHSFCQTMSLGRKAMERIIRQFEELGIIRLHRSRLATIADMLCISSWQLHDDSVVYNSIPLLPVGSHSGNQQKQKVDTKERPTSTKTEGTSGANSKSLADTLPLASEAPSDSAQTYNPSEKPSSGEEGASGSQASFTPSDNKPLPLSQPENRGASTGFTTDLFGDQFESGTIVEASQDVPKA